MRREKKKRNKIIIGLISILFLMSVGYAAFQTNLSIKGTSKISSNWDIRITNVTEGNKTGNGENAKTPTWTNLTANMEANLYEKGDAMEYEVTIENKGTFDAKLESITSNGSSNEAIKISFSGYTKGEKLYKNSTQVIKVKIEYNPSFSGTPSTNTNEVSIDLNYVQAEGGTIEPTNDYLITYDYRTNGGEGNSETAYLSANENVDLSKKGNKEGYEFVGWNTNKNAKEALSMLSMPSEDTVLYAIYKKTINVSYTKGEGVNTIGKTADSCNKYNNEESCEITLPSITASTGYNVDGWYNGTTKIGNQNTKASIKDNTSLTAKAIDNIAPTTPTIKSSYNIWGSKKYTIANYPGGNYQGNVGIDGTWVQTGTDPNLIFLDLGTLKNISGAYVELYTPLATDINVQVFYAKAGENPTERTSVSKLLKAGETKIHFTFPSDNYAYIRYDIGGPSSIGTSYKIKELGLIAEEGQWNDNSIRTIVSSTDEGSGIDHYEWYTNGAWTSNGITNIEDMVMNNFTNNQNNTYKFRAIDKAGNISEEKSVPIKIDTTKPIIDNVSTTSTTNSISAIVAAHDDESGISKYEYSLDGINWIDNGNNNTYTFSDLEQGSGYNIYVRVSNAVNMVANYKPLIASTQLVENVIASGDGLYADSIESGGYVYRGANPKNYISFNNELWRIIGIRADGKLKIIRDESIGEMKLDEANSRISDYCNNVEYGCNVWGSNSTMLNSSLSPIAEMPRIIGENKTYKLPKKEAALNVYLNGDYYNALNNYAKSMIVVNDFNVGLLQGAGNISFSDDIVQSQSYKWKGRVAIISFLDYMKASTASTCTSSKAAFENIGCKDNNYLYKNSYYWWTMTMSADGFASSPWTIRDDGAVGFYGDWPDRTHGVRPVLHLNANTSLSGEGTASNPYVITNPTTVPIERPTFAESGTFPKTVTVTYPKECGSKYTCSYQKDNGKWENVTSSTVNVQFTLDGTIVAKVSDGVSETTSSYMVDVITAADQLRQVRITSGDGIYKDAYEVNRYIYRGSSPSNYIKFNNETWRIISAEDDDTLKIIKDTDIGMMPYDKAGTRSNTTVETTGTYCTSANGCNAWGISDNYTTAFKSGTVRKASTLNEYLNGGYYNGLSSTAKNQIINHEFNNGTILSGGTTEDGYTFDKVVADEMTISFNGKVAIMNLSEYFRASLDNNCNSVWAAWHGEIPCKNSNYLYKGAGDVTTLSAGYSPYGTWEVTVNGALCSVGAGCGYADNEQTIIYPVVYLRPDLYLSGSGTETNPYIINMQ